MCGIIGLISKKDVLSDLFIGMLCLQHRGQDSAGILSFDKKMKLVKKEGLVSTIFGEKELNELKSNVAIGHTRYPTIGSDFSVDAQPFMVSVPYKIGIAHNGQVSNYLDLRRELNLETNCVVSSCDVEVILHVFAHALPKEFSVEALFNAVKKVFEKVKGSFSVVTVIEGKGLLAFRDPMAIRPLVMAEKTVNGIKSIGFASESLSLTTTSHKILRDIKPGEAVFVDSNLKVTSKILAEEKPAHCMFEWVYFAGAESIIDGLEVYQARINLGKELAKAWIKTGLKADVVIPVPDTSRTAASKLAEEINLPYREGLIKNRYIARTFIMASQAKRENGVRLKLNPVQSEIKGKNILLVDDSIVRGTTSKQIVKLLKDNGAKKVFFVSTCPPIISPCFYGIDMPSKKELIASTNTVEEIRKHIDADFLLYNSIDALKKALNREDLCLACLTGNYPVSIPKETEQEFEKTRIDERKKH
ncbi:amidophosphoribosyltransferase [Candidatus Micrarchaeota archaeon]|nr:amidophosphoribosyltransferase [Candidatus Micrarchaeota archaeon]MBU2476174.1 amidophosphoribosyltransferase [Candidatus Micrarchaeota archaeon]